MYCQVLIYVFKSRTCVSTKEDKFRLEKKSLRLSRRRIRKQKSEMCLEGRQEHKIFRTDGNASWKASETRTLHPRKPRSSVPENQFKFCMLMATARSFMKDKSYLV
jgi:hypothetical protein